MNNNANFPPGIGLRYQTESHIQKATSPVIVIGTDNNMGSVSYQIQPLFRQKDKILLIKGATHGTILQHQQTQNIIATLLK